MEKVAEKLHIKLQINSISAPGLAARGLSSFSLELPEPQKRVASHPLESPGGGGFQGDAGDI